MLTLERKVLGGFVIAVFALATLAGLTWNFSRQMQAATGFVVKTHEVLQGITTFESDLAQASAAQRAFLINGDRTFLAEFEMALQAVDNDLAQLDKMMENNPTQAQRIAELRRDVTQRIERFRHYIRIREEQGLAALQQQYGASRPLAQRMRERLVEIEEEEKRLLKERQKAETQRAFAAQVGFAALMLFLFCTLPFLFVRIRNDIRRRERSEAELRRLTDVLDRTPDIVAMADESGTPVYFNKSARMQLGIGDADARTVTPSRLYPEWAYRRLVEEGAPAAIASGSWSGDSAMLTRDGRALPVSQVLIAHHRGDGAISMSTIARSIAERAEAERLVHQAAKYSTSSARALTLYNTESNRSKVLQGTLDILADDHPFPVSAFYLFDEWAGALRLSASRGMPAGTGETFRLGEGMVGEAAQRLSPLYLDAPADGQMRIDAGFSTIAPAGLMFCPVSYRGTLLGVLAIASTEKLVERDHSFVELICNQLGAALHNIKQLDDMRLLADQLRTRSEEIARKNEQVEQASRMKSEFLANMSHELRTPLNAIIGFSEVIRDGIAGDINPEQREYASDILSSGQHLLSLINDILDLSKIESGHMSVEFDLTDGATLAASGISVLKEKAMAHAITLRHTVAPGLDKLVVDARKAKQIIYNLLSNAVKFTPDGGEVDMVLRRVARRDIDDIGEKPGRRIFAPLDGEAREFFEIAVRDTGIGMRANDLARLFQPFTQVDASHTRKYEGTGLGLMMVRRLAELHGGGVMVESEPELGSRFVVWLPLRSNAEEAVAAAAAVPAAPVRMDAAAARAPATAASVSMMPSLPAQARATQDSHAAAPRAVPLVLLIEDDPGAAKLFRMQLETEGYRIEHALDAESGLRMAADLEPDAIVLDVLLPGMDGWQMLTRLKQAPATAAIPVVIVSITDHPARGFSLGASQVLTKPVTQEELAAALDSLGFGDPAGETVLVADDDPKAVSLMSVQLSAAGLCPMSAYGGQEAIDLAHAHRPALIVLDLMMPEVSGFDVVRSLRSHDATIDIPIVILTAKILTAEDRELLNGKVQRVIEKSEFNTTVLHSEIKRALARRQRRQRAVA